MKGGISLWVCGVLDDHRVYLHVLSHLSLLSLGSLSHYLTLRGRHDSILSFESFSLFYSR